MTAIDRYSSNTSVTQAPDAASDAETIAGYANIEGTSDDTLNQNEVKMLVADMLGVTEDDDQVTEVIQEIVQYLNDQTDLGPGLTTSNFEVPDYILADLLDMDGDGNLDGDDADGLIAADGDSNDSTNIFVDNSTGYTATGDGTDVEIDYNQDGDIDITQDEAVLGSVNEWLDSGGMIDLDADPGIQDSMDIILNADGASNSEQRLEEVHKIMYALVMIGVTDDALEEFYNQVVGDDGVINSPSTVQEPINILTSALRGKDDVRQQASVVSERFGDDSHWEAEEGVMAANAREAMTSSSPASGNIIPADVEDADISGDTTQIPEGASAESIGADGTLAEYLTTGNITADVDSDILSAPIGENDAVMARLADFMSDMLGNLDISEAREVVAAMANQGMTTEQVISLLDGGATGAEDGTDVEYNNGSANVNDGNITADEVAFGLNAFLSEHNATHDTQINPEIDAQTATYTNHNGDEVTLDDIEGVVPRTPEAQGNYETLDAARDNDGNLALSDAEAFLEGAENGDELTQKRAIRDLLALMGVVSEDGTALPVNEPLIAAIYTEHSSDLSAFAETLVDSTDTTLLTQDSVEKNLSDNYNVDDDQVKFTDTPPPISASSSASPAASSGSAPVASDSSSDSSSGTSVNDGTTAVQANEYITLPAEPTEGDKVTAAQVSRPNLQGNPTDATLIPRNSTAQEVADIEDGLGLYLLTGNADSGDNLDDFNSDQLLSNNARAMKRLSHFLDDMFDHIGANASRELVAAMANKNMTIGQVITMLDGGTTGAEDGTDVDYNNGSGTVGDGKITAAEAEYGLNAFIREDEAVGGEDLSDLIKGQGVNNKATYGDGNPKTQVWISEAAVPRSAAEEDNYTLLQTQMEDDGIADVEDVENFLTAAEGGGELAQKRAIRDLLEVMGVVSEDGTALAVGDPFVKALFEKYTSGQSSISDLAQELTNKTGDGSDDTVITKESAMANLRDAMVEERGNHGLTNGVLNQIKFESAVTYSTGEPITVPSVKSSSEFYTFISGTNDGSAVLGNLNQQDKLAAFLSISAGVPAEDAEIIVAQMDADNMTLEQIFDTMNGGRIMGQGDESGATIDYGDGNAVTADSSEFIRSGEARWGLADYVESRKQDENAVRGLNTVNIDVPDATITDSANTNTGNVALGSGANETGTIAAGGGQDVISTAMNTEYQELFNNQGVLDETKVNFNNLEAIWDSAWQGNATDSEAQQRTALTLILDVIGIETASGMPLDIHDPMVTALFNKVTTSGGEFEDIMDYLVNGEVGSEDGPPTGTDPLNLDTMKHNANMLFADDNVDLSGTEVAMGSSDFGAQYYDENFEDITAASTASAADDFVALFDGADMETQLEAGDKETIKAFLVGFAGVNPEDADSLVTTITDIDPPLDIHTLYEYFDGGATGADHGSEVAYDGKEGTVGDGEISQAEVKFALSKIAADAGGNSPIEIDGAPQTVRGTVDGTTNVTIAPEDALSLSDLSANVTQQTIDGISDSEASSDNKFVFANFVMRGHKAATADNDNYDQPIDQLDLEQTNRLTALITEVADLDLAMARQYIDTLRELDPPPTLDDVFKMLDGRTYDNSDDPPVWTGGDNVIDIADPTDADDPQTALTGMNNYITARDGTTPS